MNTYANSHSAIKQSSPALLPKLKRSHNSAFKPLDRKLQAKLLKKSNSWLHPEKKTGLLLAPFRMQKAQSLPYSQKQM